MMKKMFALASVTALVGLVSAVASAGCSSTSTVEGGLDATPGIEGGTGRRDGAADSGSGDGSVLEEDAAAAPEEGTVGKICDTTADCNVADSKNDNDCTKGAFKDGDLFSTPVCIQGSCSQGAAKTVADILCDDQAGLCLLTSSGSKTGICFPACQFDATKVSAACEGNNKCQFTFTLTDNAGKYTGLGYCFGACQADTDCKGTAGQKCQVETGLCVNADALVTTGKALGSGCTKTECESCNTVGGNGPDKDKGICTRQCITGAAGDAACNASVTGWKCTAKLEAKDDKGAVVFASQPDDIGGECAMPCTTVGVDAACTALQTATGTPMSCMEFANGKFCETIAFAADGGLL
jgi:hypothetical protein